MEALVGQKGDLELDPVLDRKPVEGFEDGCDVVVLPHPHQDPGSTILDVLQPLDVLAKDPDEECIAVDLCSLAFHCKKANASFLFIPVLTCMVRDDLKD